MGFQGELSANASADYGYESMGGVELRPGGEVRCFGDFQSAENMAGESRLELSGDFSYAASNSLGPATLLEVGLEGKGRFHAEGRVTDGGLLEATTRGSGQISGRFALHHGSVTLFGTAAAAGRFVSGTGSVGTSDEGALRGQAEIEMGLSLRF
jgi:hypothetical protein